MAVYQRQCHRRECQKKKSCKHAHWCYDFWINNVRYFGAIKEARTKAQAEKAEIRIKNDVFEGKYGSHTRRYHHPSANSSKRFTFLGRA